MRFAPILASWAMCLGLASGQFNLQKPAFVPDQVEGLKLELIPDQASYELGTEVTATVRYTYSGSQPYTIHCPLNDIDRMEGLNFVAADAKGRVLVDPLPFWLGICPDQHFSAAELGPKNPHNEKVVLNQWLLFDQPGRYTITARSDRAALNEFHLEREYGEARPMKLQSPEVVITITPPVEAHQAQILALAAADLANPNHQLHWPAMKRLRYLRDPRAIPLLITGLDDPKDGPINFEAAAGLYALPDQQQVKSALLKHIDDVSESPPTYAQWIYASLLARADAMAQQKNGQTYIAGEMSSEQKWNKEITDRLARKAMANAAHNPPEQTVKQVIQALAASRESNSTTLEQKRFVLDHVEELKDINDSFPTARLIQDSCKDKALVMNLEMVAANAKVLPEIRSAATVALHDMGYDSFRDVIAADLMAQKPIFSEDVHATIGTYKQSEIGRALLKLLENEDWQVAESAADRIPAFGGGISVEDLDRVLTRMAKAHGLHDSQCFRAVYALALKSPKRAVALIELIAKVEGEYNSIHDAVLCRVEEGRPLVLKVLRTGNDYNRTAMLRELQQTLWAKQTEAARNADRMQHANWPNEFYNSYDYNLPPSEKLVASYLPEYLRIAKNEPNDETRMVALQLLAEISGIPGGSGMGTQIHPEQVGTLLPQWLAWSAKHPGES